ncbi:potassium channel protein [gamma proteobacterium HTCC5015]|nr:potassium channel protein [gamma proteobacterium HTCC5015]
MDNTQRLKNRLNTIIFGYQTSAGRNFDILLLIAICISVGIVLIDSVESIHQTYGQWLYWVEWGFTLFFTAEYVLRLWISSDRRAYATSFYGVIDLLAILPTYLSLLFPGSNYLLSIRALRMLRIFKIFELSGFDKDANFLVKALVESRRKILVFLFTVCMLTILYGSLMYLVEGPENGFTSIPRSIYWSIVTLTTVGYGDISPQTPLGQAIASAIMITGYAIIAVPTGIVTSELSNMKRGDRQLYCPQHSSAHHEHGAQYCLHCGQKLERQDHD